MLGTTKIDQEYAMLIGRNKGYQAIQRGIEQAMSKAGLKLVDIQFVDSGKFDLYQLQRMIERANLIIADLTDQNPNVMYEVGYAQALGKTVIPIVQYSDGTLPLTMAGQQVIVYDRTDEDKMHGFYNLLAEIVLRMK